MTILPRGRGRSASPPDDSGPAAAHGDPAGVFHTDPETSWKQWPLYLALLVYFAVSLLGLDSIPRTFGDESWYAGYTAELLRSGVLRHPVLSGRGGIEEFYLQPKVAVNLIAAPAVAILGVSLKSFRLCTILVGLIGLLSTFSLARSLFGRRVAFLASILLACNFWFFMVERTFRPEIFVLSLVVAYAALLLEALRSDRRLLALAAGLVAGAALLSHPVAVTFLLPASLPPLLALRRERPVRKHMAWILAGVALAIGPFVAYVIHATAVSSASFFEQLTGEGRFFHWTLRSVFSKETQRWSNFMLLPSGLLTCVLYGWALVAGFRRRTRADQMLLGMVLFSILGVALVVPLGTGRYLAPIVPPLSILVAVLVDREWRALRRPGGAKPEELQGSGGAGSLILRPRGRIFAAMKLLLVAAALIPSVAAIGATALAHRRAGYSRMIAQIQARVPGEARVAGPMVFWLGLHQRPYTVTNVSPHFETGEEDDMSWLRARLDAAPPDAILEVTTNIQATNGLGPRPTQFGQHEVSRAIQAYTGDQWGIAATIPSRDFGPVRIWRAPTEPTGSERLTEPAPGLQ